jgi:sterol desaturase/sphingolipid hydroxylase (fatty acid hydroxylase superfamily)
MEIELFSWMGMDYLFNPRNRLFFPYLLSSLLIAWFYLWLNENKLSEYFNADIWWSASAHLDYVYFLVATFIKSILILPMLFSAGSVSRQVYQFLENYLGYQSALYLNQTALVLAYAVCLFVVSDLSRYGLHRLMHTVPWLWSIHKVHHSAKVLTPITFYRVHPLENLLFGLRYAISTGVVTGAFLYVFGFGLELFEIIGVNVFVFIAHIAGDNLRHSHVALGYPDWLERILISPAQHQHHHTQHGSRKNYGGVLAIWDWMFGSLRVSSIDDEYVFGIHEAKAHNSVAGLLVSPIQEIMGSCRQMRCIKRVTDNLSNLKITQDRFKREQLND